jgi:hypothetical protein
MRGVRGPGSVVDGPEISTLAADPLSSRDRAL